MDLYSGYINKLIEELSQLPGIGEKSASRLAFHLIHMPKAKVERLAHVMIEAKELDEYVDFNILVNNKISFEVINN